MTKGWIAIEAGGAPKRVWVKLEGAKERQWIIPVMASHEQASAYWFSKLPERAWAITEVELKGRRINPNGGCDES